MGRRRSFGASGDHFATAVGFMLELRQSRCSAEWCSAEWRPVCATKTAKRCERQLAAAPL
jgi:hypothetical protein